MTVDEARRRIERIQLMAAVKVRGGESPHAAEDFLWIDVLTAIRDGDSDDVAGLAREALRTLDIEFSRWCA